MAERTANLRLLLRKDVLFLWTESHKANFQKLKDSISSDSCLMSFNSSKPVILQVDASKLGLWGCLLQEDNHGKLRSVSYAFRTLTPAETRYANIEREMLAVVWGCIKFYDYLYGRKVYVGQITNLWKIDTHLKYLSDAPPRQHRLLQKLQPYDITIKYVPGP